MIYTHSDALAVLGLKPGAARSDITKAYKRLVRIYHPDQGGGEESTEKYLEVQMAYEFLIREEKAAKKVMASGTNVYGRNGSGVKKSSMDEKAAQKYKAARSSKEDLKRFDSQLKEKKARQQKEFRELERKTAQDKAYEKAMTEIHAIRAAEIIEAMMRDQL